MTKPQPDDLDAVRTIVGALEGFDAKDKQRIIRWAQEKLGLAQQPPALSSLTATNVDSLTTHPAAPPSQGSDIKSFVEKKSPSSDMQFAATVAYYYRFEAPAHLRKESITSEDLQEACRQVGRDRLARPAQTLVNAHAQGLLDRGERGAYSINTVGENLVAMALPSEGKARATAGTKNRLGGKRTTKKTAKRKPRR